MTGGPLKPIQVIPPGLMGLLQLKQTGRLPDALLDEVRPVVELRDWYMQARRLDEIALFGAVPTTAAVATGTIGSVVFSPVANVPQSQVWYVDQAAIHTATAAATDTARFLGILLSPSGATLIPFTDDYLDTITARQRNLVATAKRPFWVGPGDRFALFVLDILSAGITFNLRLRATPLPI